MAALTVVLTILKVVVGLSFVIFWHELGHFLAAKWNGVYVKTFSIGFPPTMVRLFRHRETDYVLSWIPLGGYVRMLGEEEGDDPDQKDNPAAYHNKTVWQRMAIISAGVIMNMILGFFCFMGCYLVGGMPETPAILGNVVAGGPGYEAGLRPGDKILSIDGRTNATFQTLKEVVAHSYDDQFVRFEVQRPGVSEKLVFDIEPQRDPLQKMPAIRVGPDTSLRLSGVPFLKPAGMQGEPAGQEGGLKPGDTVVEIGPKRGPSRKVATAEDFARALAEFRDQPIELVIERPATRANLAAPAAPNSASTATRLTYTIPPVNFVDLGLRMTPGAIRAVRPSSPAARAELKAGDRIIAVDGDRDFDPIRLPELAYRKIGQPLSLEIARAGMRPDTPNETLELVPEPGLPWNPRAEGLLPDEPLDIDTLGLALDVEPVVAAVRPDSAAAKAGIAPGSRLESLTLTVPPFGDQPASPRVIKFGEAAAWPAAFDELQVLPLHEVTLTTTNGSASKESKLTPTLTSDWYDLRRGLRFSVLSSILPPQPLPVAARMAGHDTWNTATSIYRLIPSLVGGRVSSENLQGPLRIAGVAYEIAGVSWVGFIYFLGILSVNLAVLNFLPVPPLDGGHMVLLIGEAIRGEPLPKPVQNLILNVGILMLLSLIVFVLFQDTFILLFSGR